MADASSLDAVRTLLDGQRFAVLSTCSGDGQPHASLIAFSVAAGLTPIVFCTLRGTRKFANLKVDRRVALLVDDRSNDESDLHHATAVTVIGDCHEAVGHDRDRQAASLQARHPRLAAFLAQSDCAVMQVDVAVFLVVSRFQDVVEVRPVEESG